VNVITRKITTKEKKLNLLEFLNEMPFDYLQ